jgi:hypothetical protein
MEMKLENNLLNVSKPYEFQPGDIVKNINPTCTHYKSKGELVYVHSNGDLTYKVLNSGPTYEPGDQLTKSSDQMIKTLGPVVPRPAFESKINECVVAKVNLNNDTILAKNRDRAYKASIEVVHEIINNVEVLYIHDTLTDWSEGINEFGVGIVNSSLMVDFDEKEGDLAKDKGKKGITPSFDGLKIRTALSKTKLSETIKSVVYFVGQDKSDVGVKGMTIVANTKYAYMIEMTSKHLPVIKQLKDGETTVRTNHGIEYPETGYTGGTKRDSSVSRMNIATDKLNTVKSDFEVLDALSKQYTSDPFMNPYRRDNKYKMWTTSQCMMNLNKKTLSFRADKSKAEFKGYINKLPKGYTAKLKFIILDSI